MGVLISTYVCSLLFYSYGMNTSSLRVIAGDFNLDTLEGSEQITSVSGVHVPTNYDNNTLHNDVSKIDKPG